RVPGEGTGHGLPGPVRRIVVDHQHVDIADRVEDLGDHGDDHLALVVRREHDRGRHAAASRATSTTELPKGSGPIRRSARSTACTPRSAELSGRGSGATWE